MKEDTKNLLNDAAGWLAWNSLFAAFLLVFAGLVYGLMRFSRWATESAAYEVQYFAGLLAGLLAVAGALWLMFRLHAWINRRKS